MFIFYFTLVIPLLLPVELILCQKVFWEPQEFSWPKCSNCFFYHLGNWCMLSNIHTRSLFSISLSSVFVISLSCFMELGGEDVVVLQCDSTTQVGSWFEDMIWVWKSCYLHFHYCYAFFVHWKKGAKILEIILQRYQTECFRSWNELLSPSAAVVLRVGSEL